MVCNIGEPTMSLIKKIFCDGYKSIIGLLSGLVTLFMPAVPALLTAFTFIFVDAYYGYKVSKLNGYREIESHKVWKTINKLTESLVCDEFSCRTRHLSCKAHKAAYSHFGYNNVEEGFVFWSNRRGDEYFDRTT